MVVSPDGGYLEDTRPKKQARYHQIGGSLGLVGIRQSRIRVVTGAPALRGPSGTLAKRPDDRHPSPQMVHRSAAGSRLRRLPNVAEPVAYVVRK